MPASFLLFRRLTDTAPPTDTAAVPTATLPATVTLWICPLKSEATCTCAPRTAPCVSRICAEIECSRALPAGAPPR